MIEKGLKFVFGGLRLTLTKAVTSAFSRRYIGIGFNRSRYSDLGAK